MRRRLGRRSAAIGHPQPSARQRRHRTATQPERAQLRRGGRRHGTHPGLGPLRVCQQLSLSAREPRQQHRPAHHGVQVAVARPRVGQSLEPQRHRQRRAQRFARPPRASHLRKRSAVWRRRQRRTVERRRRGRVATPRPARQPQPQRHHAAARGRCLQRLHLHLQLQWRTRRQRARLIHHQRDSVAGLAPPQPRRYHLHQPERRVARTAARARRDLSEEGRVSEPREGLEARPNAAPEVAVRMRPAVLLPVAVRRVAQVHLAHARAEGQPVEHLARPLAALRAEDGAEEGALVEGGVLLGLVRLRGEQQTAREAHHVVSRAALLRRPLARRHQLAQVVRVHPVLAHRRAARRECARAQQQLDEKEGEPTEARVARRLEARVCALQHRQLRVRMHVAQRVLLRRERPQQARPVEQRGRRAQPQTRRPARLLAAALARLAAHRPLTRLAAAAARVHVEPPKHVVEAAKLLVEREPVVREPPAIDDARDASPDVARQPSRDGQRLRRVAGVGGGQLGLVEQPLQQLVQSVVRCPHGLDRLDAVEELLREGGEPAGRLLAAPQRLDDSADARRELLPRRRVGGGAAEGGRREPVSEDVPTELGTRRLPPSQRLCAGGLRQLCVSTPRVQQRINRQREQVPKVGRRGARHVRTLEERDVVQREGLQMPLARSRKDQPATAVGVGQQLYGRAGGERQVDSPVRSGLAAAHVDALRRRLRAGRGGGRQDDGWSGVGSSGRNGVGRSGGGGLDQGVGWRQQAMLARSAPRGDARRLVTNEEAADRR